MSSNSETGHAKNVANFSLMNSYVKEMGTDYNPANANIAVAALTAKETAAKAAMKDVIDALIPLKNAVNERDAMYKGMSKTATKIISALKASGASADIVKDARGIVNKLVGRRTGPKPEPDPNNPEKDTTSVSQMSFDSRKANFDLLVALLKGQAVYRPNEADITVAALENYSSELETLNAQVNSTLTALNTKRNIRNAVLYAPETGISDIATKVKFYVKSVGGTQNPFYKKIVAIKIIKPGNI